LGLTQSIDPFLNDVWETGVLFVSMLIGKKPWTDAGAPNAKAIWQALGAQRVTACLNEWKAFKFSRDFCNILADVFAPQGERMDLKTLRTKVLNPSLRIYDNCDDSQPKKRAAKGGEMLVTVVEDVGSEWVVRAVMM
jgi:hypothetical protein